MSFLCISTLSTWSQQSPVSFVDSIKAQKISNSQKAIKIEHYFESLPKDATYLEDAYYDYSKWCFGNLRDYKRAQLYGKKERALRLKKYDPKADKTKRNLYNIAYFHYYSDNPKPWESIAYYDTLIAISKDHEIRSGNAYGELGIIYDKLGDFQNALEHYVSADRIHKNNELYAAAAIDLNNILAMYVELNDPTYFEDFIEITKKIKAYNQSEFYDDTKANIIYNTAAMYQITDSLEAAKKNALESFEDFKSLNMVNDAFNSLILLGVIETKKNNFKQARDYFEQSYAYTEEKKVPISNIQNNLGSLELRKGNYEKAIDHHYDAISWITRGYSASSKRQLPTQKEISISPNKRQLFSYLYDLSNAWTTYYKESQKEEYLQKALTVLEFADTTSDELFLESQEELSKLSWRKRAALVYMDAIRVAHLLKKPEVALYYMEKKKGLLLLENTVETLAKQRANIPKQALDIEEKMLSDISKYIHRIENTPIVQMQSEEIETSKKELFSLKRKYRKFIDSLEVLYPIYVNSKKQLNISSLKDIQSTLQANELVINYALGDHVGYVMQISKNNIQLKEIPVSIPNLEQQIEKFQQVLTRPFKTSQDITDYKKLAVSLSNNLLPFIRFRESVPETSLVVIPDGIIQKVPFEALMLSEALTIPEAYLINTYTISYKYSHSLDEHITRLQPTEHQNTSFLPTTFKDNYLESLPNSGRETDEIIDYYQDHIYTQEEATKSSFLDQFEHNTIIHISTHGGTDVNGPWLAFYDKKLRLEELYATKKRKELVVLSACKTDVGDIKKGEGVFSIKRGFFKAGARSVISTLWDVNEKANMEITTSFYREIASGKKKSEALRNAKLSYLKKHANTSEASPYYWSGITLTGHDNTIDLDVTSMTYLWILLLISSIIVLFFIVRKRFYK